MTELVGGKMLFPLGGAIVGYLYYLYIGCPSGACPITANPYSSTLYGLIMGLLLSGGR
jgi:hypothetical protein